MGLNIILRKASFLIILLISFNYLNAQTQLSISGTVRDEKNATLPGATVFLTSTKSITATDNTGKFELRNINPGSYDLVIKMIGYAPVIKSITLSADHNNLNFSLKPNNLLLKGVTIRPDFNREKYIAIFKREFLGRTKFAQLCVLTNPEVLYLKYDKQKKQLTVNADDFLIIRNNALGYQLKYLLNNFEFDEQTSLVHYEGYPSFENLKGNDKQEAAWQQNRKVAYAGSINHFFKALYQNNYTAQGFDVYKVIGRPFPGVKLEHPKPVVFEDDPINFDSLITVKNKNFKSLKYLDCLYVVYKNEKESKEFVYFGFSVERPITKNYVQDGQVSLVYLNADEILIDKNGSFSPTQGLIFEGYWAWEKVGDLMPLDFDYCN